jgi:hypothetical protein
LRDRRSQSIVLPAVRRAVRFGMEDSRLGCLCPVVAPPLFWTYDRHSCLSRPSAHASPQTDRQESRGFANRSAAEIDKVKQAKPIYRTVGSPSRRSSSLGIGRIHSRTRPNGASDSAQGRRASARPPWAPCRQKSASKPSTPPHSTPTSSVFPKPPPHACRDQFPIPLNSTTPALHQVPPMLGVFAPRTMIACACSATSPRSSTSCMFVHCGGDQVSRENSSH